MRNRGSQKKSGDFWMATNFNENFVQWNSPENSYYLRALGVTCFFNIVAPEGGHKIFDHQIGGSQKYCLGTFGNSWLPIPKKMVAPLHVYYIEYWSVTSSKFLFVFAFQHFHDHISVEHDEKPSHTKFDMNWLMVARDMVVWLPN